MRKFGCWLVVWAIVAAMLVGQVAAAQKPTKGPNTSVFQLIDQLIKAKPFTAKNVSQALGLKIRFKDAANSYFDFYEVDGQGNSIVKNIDLRLPNENSDKKDGMIIVELADPLRLTIQEIKVKYGREFESFSLPDPNGPLTVPFYQIMTIKGQKVSFGESRSGRRKVVSFIIDRIK